MSAQRHVSCALPHMSALIVLRRIGHLLGGYRLWTSKQEQEKVPDEDATKRKQESADAKVLTVDLQVTVLFCHVPFLRAPAFYC